MFNVIASARIEQQSSEKVLIGDALQLTGRGSWFVALADELPELQSRVDSHELSITAPLPGEGELGSQEDAKLFEQHFLSDYIPLMELVKREKVANARRAIMVVPQNLSWGWLDDNTLEVAFSLSAGSFATSVVRELINQDNTDAKDITE